MKTKGGSEGWMMMKVDLEKAYDRLEWPFIQETLREVGIEEPLCKAIMSCINRSSFQILWNGDPIETFKPTRGISQSDPISPYIFTLCIEKLGHIIQDAVDEGEWKPIQLSLGGPLISHLVFAYDLILFSEVSEGQAEAMLDCIKIFSDVSGHRMNNDKTKVCFSRNVHFSRAATISAMLGVGLTGNMGKYLGIPPLHERASYATFASIMERTQKKLAGWKRGCLNFADRSTLISHACILHSQTYRLCTTWATWNR